MEWIDGVFNDLYLKINNLKMEKFTKKEITIKWIENDHRISFVGDCAEGEKNHYSFCGIPKSHSAWTMQFLIDNGVLFFFFYTAISFLLDKLDDKKLIKDTKLPGDFGDFFKKNYTKETNNYYETVLFENNTPERRIFEIYIIEAYLSYAVTVTLPCIILDILPTHTGENNKKQVIQSFFPIIANNAEFNCSGTEGYSRFYSHFISKELEEKTKTMNYFGLVIPYYNSVNHIAVTNCWPIDAAENCARFIRYMEYKFKVFNNWNNNTLPLPVLIISGYSQGGAAVRLLNDALFSKDILNFSNANSNQISNYNPKNYYGINYIRNLTDNNNNAHIYTFSLATMGGIHGLSTIKEDKFKEGAPGFLFIKNKFKGFHIGICHDLDPAQYLFPKLYNETLTLKKFDAPSLFLHGSLWTEEKLLENKHSIDKVDISESLMKKLDYLDLKEFSDTSIFPNNEYKLNNFKLASLGTFGYPIKKICEKCLSCYNSFYNVGMQFKVENWSCDIYEYQDFDEKTKKIKDENSKKIKDFNFTREKLSIDKK